MIKYSWKKINNYFNYDIHKIVTYFYFKENIPIPTKYKMYVNTRLVKKSKEPYPKGISYLINPAELLKNNHLIQDVYGYIELASIRNGFDYRYRGIKHLPIILVEEYQKQWLEQNNPLLTVKNGNIYFKYE